MENNICHFEIPADDLPAAKGFYSGLFSWAVEPAPQMGESYLFVRTSQEPGAVAGGLIKRSASQPGVTLYFTVANLDESTKKVEDLGGLVMVPKTAVPKLGWTVVAKDPAGNTFGLFQEDPNAA